MQLYHEARNLYWFLYYEIKGDSTPESILTTFPEETLIQIFSSLSFDNVLTNISLVNKKWNVISDNAGLLKHLIYIGKTFNPNDWALHLNYILESSEHEKALNLLENNIGKIFKTNIPLSKRKFGGVHKKIWIPKGMTINIFEQLLHAKFNDKKDSFYDNAYYENISDVFDLLKDVPIEESFWLTMKTLQPKPKIYSRSYKMVIEGRIGEEYAYRAPKILEGIICISSIFFKYLDNSKYVDGECFEPGLGKAEISLVCEEDGCTETCLYVEKL